jgi:hypothetical protein
LLVWLAAQNRKHGDDAIDFTSWTNNCTNDSIRGIIYLRSVYYYSLQKFKLTRSPYKIV